MYNLNWLLTAYHASRKAPAFWLWPWGQDHIGHSITLASCPRKLFGQPWQKNANHWTGRPFHWLGTIQTENCTRHSSCPCLEVLKALLQVASEYNVLSGTMSVWWTIYHLNANAFLSSQVQPGMAVIRSQSPRLVQSLLPLYDRLLFEYFTYFTCSSYQSMAS